LTADGDALLPRASRIVRDADEIEALFRTGQQLRGTVRLDAPIRLACNVILPRLPELLDRHPELELFVSSTDRIVDPVQEGFDCVLRVGQSADSQLVQRKVGEVTMVNCASRRYVERRGIPRRLEDLDDHLLIRWDSALSPDTPQFEYLERGMLATRPMQCSVTVNATDAYAAACRAGLGIVQVPLIGVRDELASGELVEILPEHRCPPMPVVLLHTHGRRPPHRVRAVVRWIADVIAPHLRSTAASPAAA
jgi:DNA-binding transcriptional LysR family regulator